MMLTTPRKRSGRPLAALFLAFLVIGVVGCDKKEPTEASTEPVTSASAVSATNPPATSADVRVAALAPEEPSTVVSGIPTPEDYEEEAARTLSPDYLEAELDRLEAEILGD